MSTPQSRSGAEFPGWVDDAYPSTSGAMQGLEWSTGEAWSTLRLREEPSWAISIALHVGANSFAKGGVAAPCGQFSPTRRVSRLERNDQRL
jgi:hypothetical protein